MKKVVFLIALVATVMLVAMPVSAVTVGSATMLGKEGGSNDGYAPVDPKANGYSYTNEDALLNFVHQYGSGSYSGIYSWDGSAWSSGGSDESIDVEADVEMYYESATTNNKIYFHFGNPFTALPSQKVAYVGAVQTTNHPMWVGITLPASAQAKLEPNGSGGLTGKVLGGMVGSVDLGGRPMDGSPTGVAKDSFDIQFSLRSSNAADPTAFNAPSNFGSGAHGTVTNTLWWAPEITKTGTAYLAYKVEVFPRADQNDGNYDIDPVIAVSPEL